MTLAPCAGRVATLSDQKVLITGKIYLEGTRVEQRHVEQKIERHGGSVAPERSKSVTLLVYGDLRDQWITDPVNVRSKKAVYADEQRRKGNHICIVDNQGLAALLQGSSAPCLESRPLGGQSVELRPIAASRLQETAESLQVGDEYAWETLGTIFNFEPDYLGAAGGMVSRPALDALLLMTHLGGARSIDYGDYWDGDELIYTGRGKVGDQERVGQNRDLGDNTKAVYVFEPSGSREVRFLGRATCVDEWTARHPDAEGNDRSVLRFRLRFESPPPIASDHGAEIAPRSRERWRTPRPFDPNHAPQGAVLGEANHTREEIHALREKASQGHHRLVAALAEWLDEQGWSEIQEIPLALDLWARMPNGGRRVIFEAKTVRTGSEGPRVRLALAQLLEYRFFYGEPDDRLCVVCDRPISDRRVRLLDGLGIAVLWHKGETFCAGSGTARELL